MAPQLDGPERPGWMPGPELKITRRSLPHWRIGGGWYFITYRLWKGTLSEKEILVVREHIIRCAAGRYYLLAICAMPDHVHLILNPHPTTTLARVMQKIKGESALLINRARGTRGRLWQVESWDRILRDEDEMNEKLAYMLQNPVKAGLTGDPWAWCGWYINPEPPRDTG